MKMGAYSMVELVELRERITAELATRDDEDRALSNAMTVEELVAAGMAWLDEHVPSHVGTFDPDTFDVMCTYDRVNNRPRRCVLMQAFRSESFDDVRYMVADRLVGGDFHLRGFAVSSDYALEGSSGHDAYDARIVELNGAWIAAYAARRSN